ncbi:glycosyltransferase [Citreimonas salinaria]|uniref:Glycosyl transferase family 2 n=1 Tax=Citreimonas salinaria TaxID=321339 RepID=A0A1H3LR33_9RHOB|nr:glycosyltransferase [Citreimonas salinaria]SDY66786.1 Glycosyl transferase family 2 [Citreimonas salinaria]
MTASRPVLSVIVPASNEARHLGACLDALAAAHWPRVAEVVVVVNGSRDDTAAVARSRAAALARAGLPLRVIEREEASKIGALNAGDAAARGAARMYLDADVVVSADLPAQILGALAADGARFASGRVRIIGRGAMARAYARFWRNVPFMRAGVPGCGLYAVNGPGRARWDAFPDIIADDLFARLSLRPEERVAVPAAFDWPVAEGWRNLVRVRRRQDAGVAEIARRFPELMRNEDKAALSRGDAFRLALRDPAGFAAYASVALAVRSTRGRRDGWSRGR